MCITLDHVSKAFDGASVLKDVSLRLEKGQRICLVGPSGCGKTTLLRILCGLETPDSGKRAAKEGLRYACCFQENRLLPWYSLLKNMTLVTGNDDVSRQWLEKAMLGDAEKKKPEECSGGMQRRAALVRALAQPSDVLLLDEPLRELDEATADAMLRLIDESIGSRAFVLVTHRPEEAQALRCTLIRLEAHGNHE